MTIVKDPIVQINGETITYVSNTFTHKKGVATRNINVDSGGNIHTTEDRKTGKSMVSFELYANSENEQLLNKWINNGTNNVISFIRGNLTSNCAEMTIVNTDVDIKYGTDEAFLVQFEGKPIVE